MHSISIRDVTPICRVSGCEYCSAQGHCLETHSIRAKYLPSGHRGSVSSIPSAVSSHYASIVSNLGLYPMFTLPEDIAIATFSLGLVERLICSLDQYFSEVTRARGRRGNTNAEGNVVAD